MRYKYKLVAYDPRKATERELFNGRTFDSPELARSALNQSMKYTTLTGGRIVPVPTVKASKPHYHYRNDGKPPLPPTYNPVRGVNLGGYEVLLCNGPCMRVPQDD